MVSRGRGTLTLIGLGRRPEADPTLDALDALARCDAALCVGLPAAAVARVRSVARDVREFSSPEDPDALAALKTALAGGRSVAWVGPGHPAESAPPPSARGGAELRVAKATCALDQSLAERLEHLAHGAAYYPADGARAAASADPSHVLQRADWPDEPSARLALARRLLADGRRALARGNAAEACRLLDESAAMDPTRPAVWAWMGRARLSHGQPREAWRALQEARARGAASALVGAPLDETLAALGRPQEAGPARSRPVAKGAAREPLARAEALTSAGDLEGARAAFDAAVAAEPTAKVLAARARWAARYGLPMEDVADLRDALDLDPTPMRRVAYAHALRHAKLHDLARVQFDRAARGRSAPAEAFRLRGLARLRGGDWRGALADAKTARARGSSPEELLLLRAEAAAASGAARARLKEALAEAGPSERAWLEGYAALAEGRPDPGPFERSAALGRDCEQAQRRGRVYAALARAWDWCPAPPREPGLLLCGVGVAPPLSPTVAAIAELRACDVVFQNSSSDPLSPLLRLLCRDIRPSSFRHEYEAPRVVDAMLAEVRRGRRVGFATFGHPLLFGPLALAACARARRVSIPVRVCAAPSSLGEMLAAGARLGPVPRAQVLVGIAEDAEKSVPRVDPAEPLLLYPEPGPGSTPRFLKLLAARYPAGHRALVLAPNRKDWDAVQERTLDEIAGLPADSLQQRLVFVPAAAQSRR